MLRFPIILPLILLTVYCANIPEGKGKCITIKDVETKDHEDTLYCEYITEEQLIDEIKKDTNQHITQISIWLSKMSRLPLSDIVDNQLINLKDRLKHIGIIGNKVPLNIDKKTFEKYDKITALEFENTIIHELKEGSLNVMPNLHRLEWRNTTMEIKNKIFGEQDSTIETLVIEKNKLPQVITFKRLPKLKSLSLVRDQIQKIRDSAFENNKQIHTLNLNDNLLTDISTKVLEPLERLYLLDISNNPMKNCGVLNVINDKTNLKNLYIHGWPCTTLQQCLDELKNTNEIICTKHDQLPQYYGSNCTEVVLKTNRRDIRLIRSEYSILEILSDKNIDNIGCVSDKKMEQLSDYKNAFLNN